MPAIDDLENAIVSLEQAVGNARIRTQAVRDQLAAAQNLDPRLVALTTRINAARVAVEAL